ncbi:hypothetical protein JOM56_005732 [Amanita muscaria]
MTKKQWTTEAQRTWLQAKIPSYLKAKDDKVTRDFLNTTWDEFIAEFPASTPTADEVAKADGNLDAAKAEDTKDINNKFKNWFNNHTRPTTSGTGARGQVLDLSAGPKLVQAWQAYQNLCWETELRKRVDVEWNQFTADLPEGTKPPKTKFAFRNEKVRQWYQELSPEMKGTVEEHCLVIKEKGISDEEDLNRTYQSSIDKLPRTLQTVADSIHKQTGWNVSIFVGGPSPRLDGQISALIYHHGKTLKEKDFEAYLEDKDSEGGYMVYGDLTASFDNFLHASFSEEMCQRRALIGEDDEGSKTPNGSRSLSSGPQLCEYEKTKAQNITVNTAILAELGLSKGDNSAKKRQPKKRVRKEKGKEQPARRSERQPSASRESNSNSDAQLRTLASVTVTTVTPQASTSATGPPTPGASTPTSPSMVNQSMPIPPIQPKLSTSELIMLTLTTVSLDDTHLIRFSHSPEALHVPLPRNSTIVSHSLSTALQTMPASPHHAVSPAAHDACPEISESSTNGEAADSPESVKPLVAAGIQDDAAAAVDVEMADGSLAVQDMLDDAAAANIANVETGDGSVAEVVHDAVWYTDWLQFFQSSSSNEKWVKLVSQWLQFESLKPPACRNLPAKGRPEEVHWWNKRGKSFDHMPAIKTPVEFGTIWWGWWQGMQPSWRKGNINEPLCCVAPKDAEWSHLCYGNTNGLAIIVMTLAWWIRAIAPDELGDVKHSPLFDAFADVGWILSEVSSLTSSCPEANSSINDSSPLLTESFPTTSNNKPSLKRSSPPADSNEPALKRSRLVVG